MLVQLKVLKPGVEGVCTELVQGSSMEEVVALVNCLILNRRAEAPLTQARTARLNRLGAIMDKERR